MHTCRRSRVNQIIVGSLISYGMALMLSNCSVAPYGSAGSNEGAKKLRVQGVTYWAPNEKWWSESEKAALSAKPVSIYGGASLYPNAVITNIAVNSGGMSVVNLRRLGKEGPTISLIGPRSLGDFLMVNDEVVLAFNERGEILQISFFAELVAWRRKMQVHQLVLRLHSLKEGNSSGNQQKRFSLVLSGRQLFNAYGGSEDAYMHFEGREGQNVGRKYAQLSDAQRMAELNGSQVFEVHIGPHGVICFSGEGYGGGDNTEPEWVLSKSASEKF